MKRKSGCSPGGALIFGGILTLMGGIFVLIFWGELQDYRDSSNWTESQGGVFGGEIEVSTDSDNDDTYRARVYYFYMVGDERWEGDRVKFGDDIYSGSRSAAERVLEKYPVEKQITVYYNPEDPNEVVIERSLTNAAMVFIIAGGIMLAVGVLALLSMPFAYLFTRVLVWS